MSADHSDVVVIGAGVGGLVTARDLAARGARVTIVDAAPTPGGCVAAHEVAGLTLDAGAESFATRGGTVRALIDDLGLGADVVTPARSGAWVRLPARTGIPAGRRGRPLSERTLPGGTLPGEVLPGEVLPGEVLPGHTFPLPAAGLLGIPGDLRAPEVRRAVGRLGVARAALDRALPAHLGLPEGPTTVAALVRVRMGRRVLDRLVAPVVTGVYSTPPEHADLDTVLPGIRAALREAGSLAAAVTRRRTAAPAGSAVAGLVGGMNRLVSALTADLGARGVSLRTGTEVIRVNPGSDPGSATDDGAWRVHLADGAVLAARHVVVAVPGSVAAHLLGDLLPDVRRLADPGPDVVLATLVLDAPALDIAPRGTGVLVARGTPGVRAKALTHATAKWAWLAEAAGPGRHVVRLSYGVGPATAQTANIRSDRERQMFAVRRDVRVLRGVRDRPDGTDAEIDALGDEAFVSQALADAAVLLGVPLTPSQVVGFARRRWTGQVPSARPGHADLVARVRAALARHPGLHAAGSWVAGTGLAAVVADARTLAARLPLATPESLATAAPLGTPEPRA